MYSELAQTNEEYICVIGDSFAGNRIETGPDVMGETYEWSWVELLRTGNTGELIGNSFPGQSFFHQRRWFMENMLDHLRIKSTILVFVHTHHARLPHCRNVPATMHVLEADKSDPESNELHTRDPSGELFDLVKNFYTSELYVEGFYQHAFISWIKEIQELTVNFKKVIHIFGFDNGFSNLPSKVSRFYLETLSKGNAIVVDTTLVSLVAAERGHLKFGGPDLGANVQNHLNKHNNIEFCKFIQYLINEGCTGKTYSIRTNSFNLKKPGLIKKIKPHRGGNFDPQYLIPGARI